MQTEAASAVERDYPSSLAADADGNLYLLSEKGVRRAVPGGTLAETVMGRQHAALRFPAGRCARLYGAAGQHLRTGRCQTEGGRVLHYVFDETVKAPLPDRRCVFTL